MAFVLIFVLPIFIVALTFDLLSKEKEQGTLALVLAHGVSVQTYVAAKVTARALLITALILVANLAAFITIGADLTDGRTLLEAALWIIVSVVYGLFWFALALLINSWKLAVGHQRRGAGESVAGLCGRAARLYQHWHDAHLPAALQGGTHH